MRRNLLFICLSGLFLSLQAQKSQPASGSLQVSSSTAGVAAERLGRIDSLLQEYVSNGWMAGAAALVAKNGHIFYYKAVGYNDAAKKVPLKRDAIFRIASQTKAVTSAGVMILYEEGKFLLDDAVSKYIPEFKNPKVLDKFNAADSTYTTLPARREITIRDLLTHTSGIGYAQIGSPATTAIYAKAGLTSGLGLNTPIVLGDKIKILGLLPLEHQPGEKFTYGLNTDVLGYLIEVVSGMPLDRFFRTRIFEPLGMKDTCFYLPADKQSRLVTLYTEDADHKAVKAPDSTNVNGAFYNYYPNTKGTYFSGGAGLSSTAYDYSVFLQMLLNGGTYNGKRILSPAAVRMMTSNQIGQLNISNGDKFGLGFEIVPEANSGRTSLHAGSYSWGGYFSSSYWVDPKAGIVAQLFINQSPMSHGEIHEKFKAVVYQALNE